MIYDESQFMKAVLTCLFLLTVQSYDLIWHPHSGQELRYDLKIKADIGGKPFEFRSEVELKVKSVSPNGDYELGTQFKNGVTSFDGQEEKVEEEAEDVQRYNRRGEPLDASEDVEDATSELLGQVSDFVPPDKPVRMYQNWTKEIPARKGLELPAASATYTLVAAAKKDGRDVLRVDYSYAQKSGSNPVRAKGTFLLATEDNSIVSVEAKVENFSAGEGAPPAKPTLSMVKRKS